MKKRDNRQCMIRNDCTVDCHLFEVEISAGHSDRKTWKIGDQLLSGTRANKVHCDLRQLCHFY